MKKEYRSPFLIMESFQLNAAVAGSCSGSKIVLNHAQSSCIYDNGGEVLFSTQCDIDLVHSSEDDGYCYTGPFGKDNFLAS